MVPAYVFRKKIAYLFCPDEIIGYHHKHLIFVLFNLFPSLFIAGSIIASLRDICLNNETLAPFENCSLIAGVIALIIMLYLSGIITERIIYYYNVNYKKWKINQSD